MKTNLQGFAGNLLFALNVFIIFLLIFENKLIVPYWLQPIGRMHPMILHFPIAILMLAMLLEFFRFKNEYNAQDLYQRFASNLLIIGAISSAISVIMGLFLSKEGTYTGETLQWHKWAGISVVIIPSLIYWFRNSSWYRAPLAKFGAIITFFSLIIAGHFGATLTHGENFVLEPLMPKEENVPIDQAIVFDHVIQPIFVEKCVSCHNPDKLKGKLILSEAKYILKGGKTGKLFVPGKPELSLLLQRIHLPLEDKKRMPPKDKIQLSEEEIALLFHWIKANADFKKKVIELPLKDSLRILSIAALKPENTEEEFDFAAADEETIIELNNSYRGVYPISKGSPALAVSIYNRSTYTFEKLKELSPVKTQIISLELNKIPVRDEDLKHVARFENLRKLNLNFTDITGKGLKELTSLKYLKNLSLSGTKINYKDLQQQISEFASLKTLVVWNTDLSVKEIQKLQTANKHVQIIAGFKDDGRNPIKLNPPQLKNSSSVFSESIPLHLGHPINGVKIRYTTDGTEPDSLNSPVFKNKPLLKEYTVVKAKAYKAGWLGSDVAVLTLYRNTYKPDSVILLTPFNSNHLANGDKTFFDGELGAFNANSPASATNWAGFVKNDMEVLLEFRKSVAVSSVALNTLIEPETIIFPPASIEIWGGATKSQMRLISTLKPIHPKKDGKPFIQIAECKFKTQKISYLKIIAKPLKKLPNWHKNKGKPALLLVDEILVN
ncbi:MAG: c-type cytochrome domain-containing protein [Bacteroidota bacterium]